MKNNMEKDYKTKDSWNRQQFSTWSQRDVNTGKPRYDLISVKALTRIAHLLGRGAKKYGDRNRELGQPTDRLLESLMRHMFQYADWDTSEDHLAAVCFNAMAIIHFQENNTYGKFNDLLVNDADKKYLEIDWFESFHLATPEYYMAPKWYNPFENSYKNKSSEEKDKKLIAVKFTRADWKSTILEVSEDRNPKDDGWILTKLWYFEPVQEE